MRRIKILYIAGSGRCGSTVLAQLLGEIEGFVNIGEGRYLFNRRMRGRKLSCSCGRAVEECNFWSSLDAGIQEDIVRWATRWLKAKYFPFFYGLRSTKCKAPTSMKDFLSAIERVYAEVAKVANAEVIVDSSKHPTYGLALTFSEKLDVYVLQLIRDARAVVSSWSRQKDYLRARSPLIVSAQWLIYNMLARHIPTSHRKYMRLRWEDVIREPINYLEDIAAFVDEDFKGLNFKLTEGHGSFAVSPQHVLSGNPDKMAKTCVITLRSRPWQLSKWQRLQTNAVTWPLLWKYGHLDKRARINLNE